MGFDISTYEWPAFQGRKPFIHQKHTVKFMLDHKRAFILNEMGTGKTLAALWACDILFAAKKIRKVLIVSPLSTMKTVWYNELMLNLPHRKVAIAHGVPQIRVAAIRSVAEFVIINHDGIKSMEEEIILQQFDIMIIDELTGFKSHSSERSKTMERIAKSIRAVWGMTGEITPNSPLEAFMPAKIINPTNKFLPRYFTQFRDAAMEKVNEILYVPKPIAPQIVSMIVQPAIRFTRDQCLDLPDTMYHTLETDLTPEQLQVYAQMREASLIESEAGNITAVNAAVLLNKLLQISAGAVKNDAGQIYEIGCKPRIDEVCRIFEETPQQKLVVFATFRASIELLRRELEKRGYRVACIHGDVPQNLRAMHIESFQTGPLQILILQPQSAAHGITLTAASTIIWFSLIPSNEHFQQGNARIVRAGQTRKTQIIMFVSTKAERHIARILQNKGNMSQEVLKLFNDHDL